MCLPSRQRDGSNPPYIDTHFNQRFQWDYIALTRLTGRDGANFAPYIYPYNAT
jgi:hypothetical protein